MENILALLLAPSLALANLSIAYALVAPSCARQSMAALHAVSAASLLLALFFTLLAWRSWRRQSAAASRASDDAAARGTFVALVAAMAGFLSSLVIAAQWIPQWILSPCAS